MFSFVKEAVTKLWSGEHKPINDNETGGPTRSFGQIKNGMEEEHSDQMITTLSKPEKRSRFKKKDSEASITTRAQKKQKYYLSSSSSNSFKREKRIKNKKQRRHTEEEPTTDESENERQKALDNKMGDLTHSSSEEEDILKKKRKKSLSGRKNSKKRQRSEKVTEYYVKLEPLTDEEPVMDLPKFEEPEEELEDEEQKMFETGKSEDDKEESEAEELDTDESEAVGNKDDQEESEAEESDTDESESVEEDNPNDFNYKDHKAGATRPKTELMRTRSHQLNSSNNNTQNRQDDDSEDKEYEKNNSHLEHLLHCPYNGCTMRHRRRVEVLQHTRTEHFSEFPQKVDKYSLKTYTTYISSSGTIFKLSEKGRNTLKQGEKLSIYREGPVFCPYTGCYLTVKSRGAVYRHIRKNHCDDFPPLKHGFYEFTTEKGKPIFFDKECCNIIKEGERIRIKELDAEAKLNGGNQRYCPYEACRYESSNHSAQFFYKHIRACHFIRFPSLLAVYQYDFLTKSGKKINFEDKRCRNLLKDNEEIIVHYRNGVSTASWTDMFAQDMTVEVEEMKTLCEYMGNLNLTTVTTTLFQ